MSDDEKPLFERISDKLEITHDGPADPDKYAWDDSEQPPAYVSPYGKPTGLANRIETHLVAIKSDKTRGWLGCGLVDDLELSLGQLQAFEQIRKLLLDRGMIDETTPDEMLGQMLEIMLA